MAKRSANVRSHRRRGTRREQREKLPIAPWIIITLSVVLVAGLVTGGYVWAVNRSCSEPTITATVVASPDISKVLDTLGQRWAESEPTVRGHCAAVDVVNRPSAEVANALTPDWDPRRDGPRPDVWIPESTAWLRLAVSRTPVDKVPMVTETNPVIARSPVVVAMPTPMAKALSWPDVKLTWRDLLGSPTGAAGWAQFGHRDWGPYLVGMSSPKGSAAGLHALVCVADDNSDGQLTDVELARVDAVKVATRVRVEDSSALFGELAKRDSEGQAMAYLSAFPALERDVLQYNEVNPKVPLTAMYPADGMLDADHPYAVLKAPWMDRDRLDVVAGFLKYLGGSEARKLILNEGFRDAKGNPGPGLTNENGFLPRPAPPVREFPSTTVFSQVAQRWG